MIWAAAGALPETTRDLSTVMALSPPPPATAKSFQLWPLACSCSLSAVAALASPPAVHQCRTSTSPAKADALAQTASAASVVRLNELTMWFKWVSLERVPGSILLSSPASLRFLNGTAAY